MSRFARAFKRSPLPVLWYRVSNAVLRLRPPVTVGVRVLLVREPGEVLLVRHSYRPGWYLPGGGLKRWERLEDAAKREAREEAGVAIDRLEGPVGVYANFVAEKCDHVLLYRAVGWHALPEGHHRSLEIAETRWAPLDALPEDTAPGTRRRIEEHLGLRVADGLW